MLNCLLNWAGIHPDDQFIEDFTNGLYIYMTFY